MLAGLECVMCLLFNVQQRSTLNTSSHAHFTKDHSSITPRRSPSPTPSAISPLSSFFPKLAGNLVTGGMSTGSKTSVSHLVLVQLSQSLSENQHNMMNKFCKMMKVFV